MRTKKTPTLVTIERTGSGNRRWSATARAAVQEPGMAVGTGAGWAGSADVAGKQARDAAMAHLLRQPDPTT